MKIVLVDIAAKYIHTGLAVRYLYQCCVNTFPNTVLLERTINQPLDTILADIYREKPQVIGFSCYIWNIQYVLPLCKTLREILPNTKIILGGPEVSYDAPTLLQSHSYIDFIICGEGEITFKELLKKINDNNDFDNVLGLCYRGKDGVKLNNPRQCMNLSEMPKTYTEQTLDNTESRIIYYECSRGCPYRCAYCLSGLAGRVRFFPLDRVKEDLFYLAVERKVHQIKFVDRTFNHNKKFTIEIFRFLKNLPGNTNFHFEMRADLLDDEVLEILSDLPKGKFQFEIGVQSTNEQTLIAINRPHKWAKIVNNVIAVKELGTIHQHLDLIAGLPYENYSSFAKSFNDVYRLQPEMLQLGFLKLIKGSKLWQQRDEYDFIYRHYPPYEILSTKWLSYKELLRLKDIEAVLEMYYNSGNFPYILSYAVDTDNGFNFYEKLGDWFREKNLFSQKHSLEKLFELLFRFLISYDSKNTVVYRELLKLDFLRHFIHRKLPEWLEHIEVNNYKAWVFDLLNNDKVINLLPKDQRGLSPRNIIKITHFEIFPLNPLSGDINPVKTVFMFYYDKMNKSWHHRKAEVFDITSISNESNRKIFNN